VSISHIFADEEMEIVTEFLARPLVGSIVTAGLGGVSISVLGEAGIIPRAGPLRAIMFALRSKLKFRPSPPSDRKNLMSTLNSMVEKISAQKYIVVKGKKGVGKTLLIDTATSNRFGVSKVSIDHTMDKRSIVRLVLCDITKTRFSQFDPAGNAQRVLFFYRLFCFPSPICVLSVTERKDGFGFVDLTGAVRDLREIYKLNVIVDASPNSVPEQLLTTERQNILEIPPMDRKMIENLQQLQPLMDVLKKEDLVSVAWEVLGGIPARWEGLDDKVSVGGPGQEKEAVSVFLGDKIMEAITTKEAYLKAHPHMEPVLEAIAKNPDVLITSKAEQDLLKVTQKNRPSPDKVLSIEKKNRVNVVVPASSAMRIVIKHNLTTEPTLVELQELFRKEWEVKQAQNQ
jgi:hypothetical protein